MHLASLPDRRASTHPNDRAVSDSRGSLTNRDLLSRVQACAAHLAEAGVGPRDVVALRLTNRGELIVLLFAAWRLGAAVTPVNPALTRGEVQRQVLDAQARVVVVEGGMRIDGVPTLDVDTVGGDHAGATVAAHEGSSGLALLIYTSGTTGTPKGVMLDHANIDHMARMIVEGLGIGADDRCLLILPLFHVNGLVVSVISPLLAGGSVHVSDRFDPQTFFAVVREQRPTFVSVVPTILSMLTALPDDAPVDTSSLRFIVCGAAPAASDLLDRAERRFDTPVLEGYGLSEGTCASTVNPIAGPRKAGTVGVALPGQEVRIMSEAGAMLPAGVDGEVVVRGPNVMRGYLNRPVETAATVIDGWLHTGDLGRLDADGYLTIVGRSKDMIIRGGENIYPKEIEDVLTADPTVLEAAVIGVPDETWGEVVVAYVQPRPGRIIDVEALAQRCAVALSRYKRPTRIIAVDTIPTNAVGKIDKRALRASHLMEPQETG